MNKNNMPLISVVIPAFNAEKTIKKTIKSVLNQSYKNFELIIVDDNSKDATVSTIKESSDKRVRLYINEKNLGFEKNWNKALNKASGLYIKLLPDDDTLAVDALFEQMKILEKFDNVVLVGSKRNIIDEKDNIIMQRGKKLSLNNPSNYTQTIKSIMRLWYN